jgi:hypothetical protein
MAIRKHPSRRQRGARRSGFIAIAVIVGGTASRPVAADQLFTLAPADIPSVFFIAKSQNKNQVHYGIHVDRDCRPHGDAPVFAYWRMLEDHGHLEPLLDREVPAYGLCERQVVESAGADQTSIRVCLRALSDRPVVLNVGRTASGCQASASTTIAGTEARLHFVYARLAWLGIDYLLFRGARYESGLAIEEIVRR